MSDSHYDLLANGEDRKQQSKTSPQRIAARLLAVIGMASLRRRRGGNHVLEDGRVAIAIPERKQWRGVPSCSGVLRVLMLAILIITMFNSIKNTFCSDVLRLAPSRSLPERPDPSEVTKGVRPVDCHSHNDYLQQRPLFDDLDNGCISVEADVWYVDPGPNITERRLFISHTRKSVKAERTLQALYLDPLLELLDARNPDQHAEDEPKRGIFVENPDQSLILLVDFKTSSVETFGGLYKQLEHLRARGYLTHFDGQRLHRRPITVVATGSVFFEYIFVTEPRDIFFDAPLDRLTGPTTEDPLVQNDAGVPVAPSTRYNRSNSFYASAALNKIIGPFWMFMPTNWQRRRIQEVVTEAHNQNLVVRIWDTPAWPRSRREAVWKMLMEEGVDVLNVDDLPAAAKLEHRRSEPGSPLDYPEQT